MRGVGFALIELNRLDEAEQKYRLCLEIDPQDSIAMNELRYIEKLRKESAAVPSAGRAPDENDIVLLPANDFSFDYAAALARMVAADTGLRIRAMLPLGTRDWQPYVDVPQYDPDGLKNLALPVIAQLKKSYGGMVYVVLTTRDINSADRNLRSCSPNTIRQRR